MLRTDAAARRYYIEAVDVEAALWRQFGAFQVETPSAVRDAGLGFNPERSAPQTGLSQQEPTTEKATETALSFSLPDADEPASTSLEDEWTWRSEAWYWISRPMALSAVVSALVITTILLSLALWIIPAVAPTTPEDVLVARPTFVALLAGAYDATWAAATAEELAEGRDLYVGQKLELIAGSAEIRYDSGVRVRLFGPAEWSIPSAEGLQLERGQAVARVTPNAVGFTVGTRSCDVIDLGTEFAVGCESEGDVNVYVHQGEVEVAQVATDQQNIRLSAGESITISRQGDTQIAGPEKREELKRLALAAGVTNNMETWSTHRDELKADESLVAYYDFQRNAERPDNLVNIAKSTSGTLNGQLGRDDVKASQPTWSEVRFRGKDALQFDGRSSQFVRIRPAEALDFSEGITVALWVRFDGPTTALPVLVAQREGGGPFAFQMAAMSPRNPVVQFMSQDASGQSGGYSGKVQAFGTDWQLLVATSNEEETVFYRNGREIGRAAGTKRPAGTMPISIGVSFMSGAARPAYPLSGTIDEIAIFRRVISSDEASELFLAGRP